MAARPPTSYSKLCLAVSVVLATLPAWADDAQLAPIVVTATRSATPIDRVPASVSVINDHDLDFMQAASVVEAMQYLPNVGFPGGPRLNSEIPTIRGLKGPEITVLVDGARQNDWIRGGLMSPLFVDPYFLASGEVLRGSGSSLYGPGGIGGVMSFSTLSALDLLSPDQTFGAEGKLGLASADNSKNTNARVYGRFGAIDGLVALGHHEWQHIRQGEGTYLEPNVGDSDTGLVKLGVQAMKDLRLELSSQFYHSRNLEPINPLVDWTYPHGTLTLEYNSIKRDQTVLKATKSDESGRPLLAAAVYKNLTDERSDPAPNVTPNTMYTKTDTTGFSIQGSHDFTGAGSHRVTAGVDYFKDEQSVYGTGNANPNGTRTVYGAFAQDELAFAGTWRLIPSLRWDHYDNTPKSITSVVQSYDIQSASSSTSHTSPKVTLAWQATPSIEPYVSYGEAFRAPTLNEMYMSTTVASCAALPGGKCFMQFAANPDLKPELDKTTELGANFKRAKLFTESDVLRIRGSLFDSKITDMITLVRIGPCLGAGCTAPPAIAGVRQSQNLQKATRTGGELEIDYVSGPYRSNVAYSHVRIKNTTSGSTTPDPFSPPDKLVFQLRYQFAKPELEVRWSLAGFKAQEYDSTVSARRPGYAVQDLFSELRINRHAALQFGIANLLDKRYAEYNGSTLGYYPIYAAGRSVKAALSATF